MTILHLRTEAGKPLEHRCALTPSTARALVEAGYKLKVEKSNSSPDFSRIFEDSEFSSIPGVEFVEENSWIDAPASGEGDEDYIIIGLKELKEEDWPVNKTMIHFAHCYKQQNGWEKVLGRFAKGKGLLYDLEFLQEANGRRVAAFGYHAGFAGAALALKAWSWQVTHPNGERLPSVAEFTDGRGYYENDEQMVKDIQNDIAAAEKAIGRKPRVMVMGALGRCGGGACDLFVRADIPDENIIRWDIYETRDNPGPYKEIVESDVFLNAIYLMNKVPPFVDRNSLATSDRKLAVVCDVSCDPNSANNPLPIYSEYTSFTDPTTPVKGIDSGPALSVISIDHLPSLLPRESSEAFSSALLPSLLQLKNRKSARVWTDAEKLFHEKVSTLPESERS
ncbi:saccharopine dehydrogenase [Patellaria atrata CBS 101060]|uniref:Saccharopine dehydrogenase [NAD(+), L-lysine-forming] n=1 Tax=Patellaria atrata CBS 101060 TaxID=1346257 RepID=A0A9P4SGR7_9PEZI|nr:saccharopine dehydrogenase [Patellaria atrata CBS 101060]